MVIIISQSGRQIFAHTGEATILLDAITKKKPGFPFWLLRFLISHNSFLSRLLLNLHNSFL